MTILRKVVPAQMTPVGDDEVEVILSTANLARDGHILVPQGALLDNYRLNPIVLWQHDPEHPVGNAEALTVSPENITARVKFAPVGTTRKADETRGLVKNGIVRAVSIGFEPLDGEPLDPKKPRGGQRFTKWELLECSFVSVPADTGAVVTARANGEREMADEDWKVGTSRNLPIEDSDAWDGGEAEASIFKWAGGDDFDGAKARKGFLFYNANKPKERSSYKDPIAHVVDGRLVVPKGAIRAAASRLPQTDVPEGAKKKAQAVLDHYKEKAGMSDKEHSVVAAHKRALSRAPAVPVLKRGLYEVASLAYQLEQLGYAHACAEWEAALEGDDSKVPAMLGEALKTLGGAFIAMAEEEAEELLDNKGLLEDDDDDAIEIDVEERAYIAGGKTPRARAWRKALVMLRAGKALSQSNLQQLEEAQDHHARALKHHRSATEAHGEVGKAIEKARSALKRAMDAADGKEVEKAQAQCRSAAKALDGVADHHEDVGDAHRGMARCVRAAERCVRSVVDGAVASGEDSDSKDVQNSSGETEEDKGSRTAEYWQREVARLRKAA
ncbi:MAG TPA: HK97 family phage prohead protease [Rhizomicrobium sp.]|nr:HK97 family phage prohead protease [Rhizomicrobium sp.]